MKKFFATCLVLFLLCVLIVIPFVHVAKTRAASALDNARQIYAALQLYQADNRRLPERLSELVPQYVTVEEIPIFFVPRQRDYDRLWQNAQDDIEEIDRDGAFAYTPAAPDGVILRNRVPLAGGKIVIRSDGTGRIENILEENGWNRWFGWLPWKK